MGHWYVKIIKPGTEVYFLDEIEEYGKKFFTITKEIIAEVVIKKDMSKVYYLVDDCDEAVGKNFFANFEDAFEELRKRIDEQNTKEDNGS